MGVFRTFSGSKMAAARAVRRWRIAGTARSDRRGGLRLQGCVALPFAPQRGAALATVA
jgi:hypothetical protein